MEIEQELRALRKAVAKNTDSNKQVIAEMKKLSAIGEVIKGHESFLQGLVRDTFNHQRKQATKVLDFLLGKMGWILTAVFAAAFGASVTGVI